MRAAVSRLTASVCALSPDSLAIILAVGLVLGTFPVCGCPTVLCLLAVLLFRINAPALHLVNQLVSPLQLALLIPLAKLGERILPSPDTASHNLLSRFAELTLQAIAGWFCLAVPLGILLYLVLSCIVRWRRPARFDELEIPA